MAEGVTTTSTTLARVARLRLFAQAREAAGTGEAIVDGDTVGHVLEQAAERFGPRFEELLVTCRVWVNGEPAQPGDPVVPSDEVAVLPPVSGGA
jgi:molybdopterin converting factor small subunit